MKNIVIPEDKFNYIVSNLYKTLYCITTHTELFSIAELKKAIELLNEAANVS